MNKKYKRKRILTFVVLVVAICFMSVGFAAFSSELTISSSAIVKPDSGDFKVVFSSSGTSYLTDKITGVATGGATGGSASIDNTLDVATISDLTASFTGPGESVSYEFYAYNIGAYDAYLKSIKFENVSGESSSKVCSAIDSSSVNNDLLVAACNDINVTIETSGAILGGTADYVSGCKINKGAYEKVIITITYSDNDNAADGDFKVEFGDIRLTYSTVDSSNSEEEGNPGA